MRHSLEASVDIRADMAQTPHLGQLPVEAAMIVRPALDDEELLSDLLSRWFRWQQSYGHNRGYPSLSAGMADWRASRQYDFENGAMDAATEKSVMETVDFEASQVAEPGRTGLHVNARALAMGLSVFRSPRLPECQIKTLEIIEAARKELSRRLAHRGVL